MRCAFVTVLFAGLATAAGEVLVDDFEGPNRLLADAPPGPWANLDLYSNVTLMRSASAANRGSAGLRVDDQSSLMGPGDMTALYSPVLPLPRTASLRFWVRVSSNGLGAVTLGQLLSNLPGRRTLCDVGIDLSTRQLLLDGADSQGVYQTVPSTAFLDAGTMTLIECTVRGMGTLSGERLLHANGALVAQQTGIDLRDAGVLGAAVGMPYSDGRLFTGVLDFDDVRLADRLQASRLWVYAGVTTFIRGQCTAVDVGFADSEGRPQSLPYDVTLSTSILQAQPFSDPTCTGSFFSPTLLSGQTQVRFYVRPAVNSPVSIGVSHRDLIAGSLDRPLVDPAPDAGAPDAGAGDAGATDAGELDAGSIDAGSIDTGSIDAGSSDAGEVDAGATDAGMDVPASPLTLAVGCGCASVSPFWALGALLLFVHRRRSRSSCR